MTFELRPNSKIPIMQSSRGRGCRLRTKVQNWNEFGAAAGPQSKNGKYGIERNP